MSSAVMSFFAFAHTSTPEKNNTAGVSVSIYPMINGFSPSHSRFQYTEQCLIHTWLNKNIKQANQQKVSK